MSRCLRPPPGWYCTRTPGHDGPCAAWPRQPRRIRRLLARLLLPRIRVHVDLAGRLGAHRSRHRVELAGARAWLCGVPIPIAFVQWLDPLAAAHRCRLTVNTRH